MYSVETLRRPQKNRFDNVAEPFLQQSGLPFAQVLTGETIEGAFAQHDALFAEEDIFCTSIVLWAFLAQVLRGGKGAACAAAVADIATYLQQTGGRVPSGDTGDYCRARSKLNLTALRGLVMEVAQQLEVAADPSWHGHGLHAKLIDGFTFTMPDTPENQAEFPQQKSQRPGVGFPSDFRQGRRLGPDDHWVTWTRPKRPSWMSEEVYEQIPETLTLREVRFQVTIPGRRTETLIVVTSLTDAEVYPQEDLAELYGYRWNAEMLIKDEKQNLGLGAYRVLRYRAVVRHLHLVDCAHACLTHVGLEAQRAQGRKDAKNVLRLPPIRQLKQELRQMVWNEALKGVAKVSHERAVIRRLEKLLAA